MSNSFAPRSKFPPPIVSRPSAPPDSSSQERPERKSTQLLGPDISAWLNEMGLEARIEIVDSAGEKIAAIRETELLGEAAAHHSRASTDRDLSALGSLTASMSHEVRNILAGVLGLSQLRARSGPEAPTFATIAVEAARGTQLLSNFLSISRDSESSSQLTTFSDVIEPIRLLTIAEAQKRFSTILFRKDEDNQPFVTDGNRAKQILLNLVLNALQATGENGCLEVNACLDGPWVIFTVDDNGPGVPEAEREKIFEPFYSTKQAEGGTGLGLSKAKQLANRLGGQLQVSESPLGGARFELRLPTRYSSAAGKAVRP